MNDKTDKQVEIDVFIQSETEDKQKLAAIDRRWKPELKEIQRNNTQEGETGVEQKTNLPNTNEHTKMQIKTMTKKGKQTENIETDAK